MVTCLERVADLHMAQLMPLPLTVSCSSQIQVGFTFLVPARPGSPGQRAVKQTGVCVCMFSPYTFHCHIFTPDPHPHACPVGRTPPLSPSTWTSQKAHYKAVTAARERERVHQKAAIADGLHRCLTTWKTLHTSQPPPAV